MFYRTENIKLNELKQISHIVTFMLAPDAQSVGSVFEVYNVYVGRYTTTDQLYGMPSPTSTCSHSCDSCVQLLFDGFWRDDIL